MNSINPSHDIHRCIQGSEKLSRDYSNIDDKKFAKLEKKIHKLTQEEYISLSLDDVKNIKKDLSSIKNIFKNVSNSVKDKDVVRRVENVLHDLAIINQKLELDMSNQDSERVPKREKVDVVLGIVSDFEVKDQNGFCVDYVKAFLKNKTPFIASGSVFNGAAMPMTKRLEHLKSLGDLCREDEWAIFELVGGDRKVGSGLFVFLPAFDLQKREENDLLKQYDLAWEPGWDKQLQRVAASRVYECHNENPNSKSVVEMFSKNPQKNKMFHWVGHGTEKDYIGGVAKQSFNETMRDFESIHCKGLLIDSCCVGGINSEIFSDPLQPAKFPVLLSSIGDFVVNDRNSVTYESRLKTFKKIIENPLSSPTAEGFHQKYELVQPRTEKENYNPKYDFYNLMQINFPSPKNVASGFRVVGEGAHIYPITNAVTKQAEITHQTIKAKGDILGLTPTIISPEISFDSHYESGYKLHSTLPGDSVHILKHLSVMRNLWENLIRNTLEFNTEGKVNKAFCMGRLTDSYGEFRQEVVILCTSNTKLCAFKKDGKYYEITPPGYDEKEISPLRHAMHCKNAANLARQDQDVLNNPRPGISGKTNILNVIKNSDLFFEEGSSSLAALNKWSSLMDDFQKDEALIDFDQAKQFFEDPEIFQDDKNHYLALLFRYHPKLGLECLETLKTSCPSDAKNRNGSNLAVCVTNNKSLPIIEKLAIIEKLIDKGVNCFERNKAEYHALDYALDQGQWQLVDKMLTLPHETPLKPSLAFVTAITNCIETQDQKDHLQAQKTLNDVLLQTDQVLSFDSNEIGGQKIQTNLLETLVLAGTPESVGLLLASNVNPNQSDFCLWLAINQNKESIAELLLEKGADPLRVSFMGCPLIEAAINGSPKVLELMINAAAKQQLKASRNDQMDRDQQNKIKVSFLSDIADKDNFTPLTAAVMGGDQNKIQLLLDKGIGLPSNERCVNRFCEVIKAVILNRDLKKLEILKDQLIDDRALSLNFLDNILFDDLKFLIANGFFDSKLKQMDPSTLEFARLVETLISMKDLHRLNSLSEQLKRLIKLDHLNNFQKLFLIEEKLIDPNELQIDVNALKEMDSSSSESDSDSDSDFSDSE